jgi:hypothetical protein
MQIQSEAILSTIEEYDEEQVMELESPKGA